MIPAFYDRGADGLPAAWLVKVRQSMTTLTAQFSANRAVRQYTTEFYVPGAAAYEARRAKQCALGVSMAQQRQTLARKWHTLSFGAFQVDTREGQHYFQVEVNCGEADPAAVQVELYADGLDGPPIRQPMVRGKKLPGGRKSYVYRAQVAALRPTGDFTPRLIAKIDGLAVPLETSLIMWQR